MKNMHLYTLDLQRNIYFVIFGEDYTTVREQGVTIFISDRSDAAWVNGGILYKLTISSGTLTKKQIKNIALSL